MTTTAKETTTVNCYRCNGTGEFVWHTYQGLNRGLCFRCGGSGIDPKPAYATKQREKDAAGTERAMARQAERVAAAEAEREVWRAQEQARRDSGTMMQIEREVKGMIETGNFDLAVMMIDVVADRFPNFAAEMREMVDDAR